MNWEIKTTHHIWTYLSILALVAALGLSLTQISQRQTIHSSASGGVVLSMIKSKPNLKAGDDFSVDVLLNTRDEQVTNADLYLSYPTDVLQAYEVTPGTLLPQVLEPVAFGNGSALIRVVNSSPQKGGGIVGSVKFRALASGSAAVQFSNETVVTDQTQKGQVVNLVDKAIGLKFEVK